jgi:ribosomal protein S18 acetylase RimI-like enzyme
VRYEVKHLYLQPRTRGRGWGRLLLDALEERPRSARPSSCSTPTTREAAGALYARAGFTAIEPYNDNPNATALRQGALSSGVRRLTGRGAWKDVDMPAAEHDVTELVEAVAWWRADLPGTRCSPTRQRRR